MPVRWETERPKRTSTRPRGTCHVSIILRHKYVLRKRKRKRNDLLSLEISQVVKAKAA